ncbi:deSI-like protein At4g17486 isoform X1 [Typha latifolia]|uniref:deSI-like protein At4g17486 isoform X1 n=1 Tax=Typha latifolia TaxID=4733 RepID=UPI003C2D13F6
MGDNTRSLLGGSSSMKERSNGGSDGGSSEKTHLYLNVYDLSPINNYLYWFGLGIFHSGIEVHGMEYGFGAHEYPTSGVFEVEPRRCPGYIFRRSMWLGTTGMSRSEFRIFIENLTGSYHGDTYHLIIKNCNHFTNDVCKRLTGKCIPGWVNRLAKLVSGSFCNCLLPASIQVTAVGHLPTHLATSDDGSASDASTLTVEESDEEEADQHLLAASNSDLSHSRSMRLAKDMM